MGLRCKNIKRTFGSFTLQTDLQVDDGKLVTLLGPSGCGKTTTLQLIAGIIKPDDGKLYLHGKDISDTVPWKRNIGIVFQDYALFPHMNVFKNISYGLKHKETTREEIKETVYHYLDLVGLTGYENRDIESLSGGEKQRVALARALAPSPRLLLLDEPLSALDKSLRKKLRREIRRIQQQLAITTIYVTHDQEEALAISDTIVIMNDGGIEQTGSPAEIYNRPATEFTARFLGSSNLVPGRVTTLSKTGGINVQSRITGSILHVPFQEGTSAGDEVWVFFRSGYTRPAPTTEKGENSLAGIVTCVEYYGTHTLFEIDVRGITILAEQPESGPIHRQYTTGEKVRISVAPEHCHVIQRLRTI